MDLEGRSHLPVPNARRRAQLITIEEHAVIPIPGPAMSSTQQLFDPLYLSALRQRLGSIEHRLKVMDANNIGAQVISLSQPSVQGFVDLDEAVHFCKQVNHFVFENYCYKHPQRFFAFAMLPTQNGQAAAQELSRCVQEYGFVGAMINGFTNTQSSDDGLYLDDPQFDALWRIATTLKKPIFIHPRVPLECNIRVLKDMPIFHGAPYGFGRETTEHVLRLMYSGVFDRFPDLKICLGHLGEGLSWTLSRADSTFRIYTKGESALQPCGFIFKKKRELGRTNNKLTRDIEAQGTKKKTFLEYFQQNIVVNTSGFPRTSNLMQVLQETKGEHVLFSVDYPYESVAELREWFEGIPVSDETWKDIGWRNANKLFGLNLKYDDVC